MCVNTCVCLRVCVVCVCVHVKSESNCMVLVQNIGQRRQKLLIFGGQTTSAIKY